MSTVCTSGLLGISWGRTTGSPLHRSCEGGRSRTSLRRMQRFCPAGSCRHLSRSWSRRWSAHFQMEWLPAVSTMCLLQSEDTRGWCTTRQGAPSLPPPRRHSGKHCTRVGWSCLGVGFVVVLHATKIQGSQHRPGGVMDIDGVTKQQAPKGAPKGSTRKPAFERFPGLPGQSTAGRKPKGGAASFTTSSSSNLGSFFSGFGGFGDSF